MKKIIVTGANGFIGMHAIERLSRTGFEVHCVALEGEPLKKAGAESKAVWHRLNLLKDEECSKLFDDVKPEYLLHLAWYTEHGKYWNSELNIDWVKASLEMLKAFAKNGGKRAVLAGTCAEYDWDRVQKPCVENSTPTNPKTLYGASKNSLRLLASSFCKKKNIELAWGRIFQPFGPFEPQTRLVPSTILSILQGTEAKCTVGSQLRDFMHSPEVASAFVALLKSRVEGPVNIATGNAISIKDLVLNIANRMGHPELIRLGALPISGDDPPVLIADVARLRDEVGWHPEGDIDSWLEKTVKWWAEKRATAT